MKKMAIKKILAVGLCSALGMIVFPACGGDDDDHGGGGGWGPVVYDHSFVNGVSSEGDAPVDGHVDGPLVSDIKYNNGSRSVVVQGDKITLNIGYSDNDGDMSSPSLIIQVMGLDEYWTFDDSQFGMLDNSSAVVRVNVSQDFEPGTYILMAGLMDDAGHVQDLFYRLFIVLPYVLPDIVEMLPQDGDSNAALNTGIVARFSAPVIGDPPTLSLSQAGGPAVTGQGHLIPNRKVFIFQPDSFLLPDADYVATISITDIKTGDVKQHTHQFKTEVPVPSVSTAGKVYAVEMTVEGTIEPPGAELFVGDIPPFLFKMKTFNQGEGTIDSVACLSDGADPLHQIVLAPTWNFAGLSHLLNPYFSLGPKTLNVDLTPLGIPVMVHLYDFTLSGRFGPAGDFFDAGIISAYIDSVEINTLLGPVFGGNFDICLALPDADCDEQGRLSLYTIDVSGIDETADVPFLYDLTVIATPDTVSDATGGVLTISGAYLVDGDPDTSATHTVNLSTTHGLFPGDVTNYSLDTAAGVYSVDLTVPSGQGVGTEIKVTAVSASPFGNIPRAEIVTVE
jgi:hypothetical protein